MVVIPEPTSEKSRFLVIDGTKFLLSISSMFLENIKVKGPQCLEHSICTSEQASQGL